MTLLRIGRSIVDNNIDFFETCPMVHLLTKIPVPFSFPGKNVTLMYPTPLILAVYLNRPEIVQFLLEHENDPDLVVKEFLFYLFYETPLHIAALYGCFDAVYRLYVNGADINAYANGDNSKTPLNYALLRNHKDIIAFLIHKGAERQFLDFSHVPYREEMMQFVHEGYLDDEYNEEKMISKFCKGRIDDVLEFQYPECPEIDPEKRYANKEYIKEIKERNKRYVKKKEQKNEKNDDDDDNNHDDINAE